MKTFNPPNLSNATELVYDVETNGLDWKQKHIVGYVMTWGPAPDETKYWPTRHETGINYDHDQVTRWVRDLAKDGKKLWTGHNMKFDIHMSKNEEIDFAGILNCTQMNAALINENQGTYSLEKCAQIAGVPEKKGQMLYDHLASQFGGKADKKQMGNFWKLSADDPFALEYAEGDGVTTWHLWKYQEEILNSIYNLDTKRTGSLRAVWELECRVLKTLFRMERLGVKVDGRQYEWIKKAVDKKLDQALDSLPDRNMNVKGKDVERAMLDSGIDEENWPRTGGGKLSFTVETLEHHPIGQAIIMVRKLRNFKEAFLDGQVANHIHNGRIHTNFNQLKMDDYGTVTGRLSSNAPNLQQVPKRNKELAPLFRSLFVPDTGMYWSTNDYMQQEFVVFAHLSKAKALIDGYNQDPPIDTHTMTANMMGVERDPTAKRLGLGKLYWMGVPKLAGKLGISVKEAQALSDKWDATYPEASKFRYQAKRAAEKRGWVCSLLGRQRRFEGKSFTYQAGNSVVQMGSADITKLKMVEIDDYFRKNGESCQLLLQVHDELNWQVPCHLSELDEEAIKIMGAFGPEDIINLRATLHVDHDMGDNWGIATFGEGVRSEIQREGV